MSNEELMKISQKEIKEKGYVMMTSDEVDNLTVDKTEVTRLRKKLEESKTVIKHLCSLLDE